MRLAFFRVSLRFSWRSGDPREGRWWNLACAQEQGSSFPQSMSAKETMREHLSGREVCDLGKGSPSERTRMIAAVGTWNTNSCITIITNLQWCQAAFKMISLLVHVFCCHSKGSGFQAHEGRPCLRQQPAVDLNSMDALACFE